jgi:plasmid stability protein
MSSVQYTVRGVPEDTDRRLRACAHRSGKSLNALLVELLERATTPRSKPHDDLDWFIGRRSLRDEQAEVAEAQEWLDAAPMGLE